MGGLLVCSRWNPLRVGFVTVGRHSHAHGLIGEIVSGKRAVTADTDLRLCSYFDLSDGWWLRGQAAYDTAIAKQALHR
jgi:addiction module HigA family antidote